MRSIFIAVRILCWSAVVAGSACKWREPPSVDGPLNAAPQTTEGAPMIPALETSSGASTTIAMHPAATPKELDALVNAEGSESQTTERPRSDSAKLHARAQALLAALSSDTPDAALPFFFPSEAYVQVKAIAHPEADWKRRLVAAFARDIHALHKRVAANATFVALEIAEPRVRWVEPGEEGNRIGYYRVYGAKLRYRSGPGTQAIEDFLELKSLISWRGEWFVVHLSGFK
jgi:hypothetical protein